MRELTLHILDLFENAVAAGASRIELFIAEQPEQDSLLIRLSDNGRGMDEQLSRRAVDPFVTTKTVRRVGLGLPLLKVSAERSNGYLRIVSRPGSGTTVEAEYKYSHIDRPPLGRIDETVKLLLITNPDVNFCYRHIVRQRSFRICTGEITGVLAGVPLARPEVMDWLSGYLTENIIKLYGGELR